MTTTAESHAAASQRMSEIPMTPAWESLERRLWEKDSSNPSSVNASVGRGRGDSPSSTGWGPA